MKHVFLYLSALEESILLGNSSIAITSENDPAFVLKWQVFFLGISATADLLRA